MLLREYRNLPDDRSLPQSARGKRRMRISREFFRLPPYLYSKWVDCFLRSLIKGFGTTVLVVDPDERPIALPKRHFGTKFQQIL